MFELNTDTEICLNIATSKMYWFVQKYQLFIEIVLIVSMIYAVGIMSAVGDYYRSHYPTCLACPR